VVSDLVLFPHCDLHMVLPSAPVAPKLTLRVFNRVDPPAGSNAYQLNDFTGQCDFEFFAPHRPTGQRIFAGLPSVDKATGVVTATTAGVYLFQIRLQNHYIVGRLQVHKEFADWWFGNDSITTAREPLPNIGHAQPSIYAKFNDDAGTGTDLVGDITGHGYVPLSSPDAKVELKPNGRLRGVTETTTPVEISGLFLGTTKKLPVRVVDYDKPRRELFPIQTADLANNATMHNMVVLAEGFKAGDEPLFTNVVTQAMQREMLDKPRHEPYAMLEASFNVFRAATVSQQNLVTCGYRVTDTAVDGVPVGTPIPYNQRLDKSKPTAYTPQQLVARVGLPMRGETRDEAALKTLWGGQGLHDFVADNVDKPLVDAWKAQQSAGIPQASDTFFGLYLGGRYADRFSGGSPTLAPVIRPAADDGTDALKAFVKRVYEFYSTPETRLLTPDPRRHPPELYAGNGSTNLGCAIMRYLASLEYAFTPFHPVGKTWMPDETKFKPSRGLVAILAYDDVIGGANCNKNTLTTVTLNRQNLVPCTGPTAADPRVKRVPPELRTPQTKIVPNLDKITNTIAHEFGHSFNLNDEYEGSGGDDTTNTTAFDLQGDNAARLAFIRAEAAPSRKIDPTKVKWLTLPRMRLSARLLAESKNNAQNNGIEVTVRQQHIGKWLEAAKDPATRASLRKFNLDPVPAQPNVSPGRLPGQQLPFRPGEEIKNLELKVDPAGKITLTGGDLPAGPPFPVFPVGSVLYLPLRDGNDLVQVTEKDVLAYLNQQHKPLNLDEDTKNSNDKPDSPIDISGFKEPCQASTMIGVYEGAVYYAGGNYRPAGTCKMRSIDAGEEFCFVCRWLIVNRVDPGYHSILDAMFYPKAKKND